MVCSEIQLAVKEGLYIKLKTKTRDSVSNSLSKYITANFTILLFSKTAKETQNWIWNSCLEWPKAGTRQYLKEIRDNKFENQIFRPKYMYFKAKLL